MSKFLLGMKNPFISSAALRGRPAEVHMLLSIYVCLSQTGWICLQIPLYLFFFILKPSAATSPSPQRAATDVFTCCQSSSIRPSQQDVGSNKSRLLIYDICQKRPIFLAAAVTLMLCDLDAHRHFLSAFPRGYVHIHVNKFQTA